MNGAKDPTNGAWAATGGQALANGSLDGTATAWERFVSGADTVQGVRPEILMSWYRCREEYGVNPCLDRAPAAVEASPHSIEHDVVFAQLGGVAAFASNEVGGDALATVTDPEGRVLVSHGSRRVQRLAASSNLAPWSTWSEWASGTNGMGTALESHGPVIVAGPEHWCSAFHSWTCAGIAVHDVVTDEPLAAIGISCWKSPLPGNAVAWLSRAVATVEATLRQRAHHAGTLPAAIPSTGAAHDSTHPAPAAHRVVALRQDRWVLLEPAEIRFAEVDHNNVWLMSDQGRLLAATRGLDHIERQLQDKGFLRVHRRFLVNLNRIREVEQGFKGALFLHTDTRTHESIPVARRHMAQVRRSLGL
jgi:transcriptional regulator of acetoin/glycerol metabolism